VADLSILGKGFARELPDHVAAELISRVNDLPHLTAIDELVVALTKARNGGARYRPSEDQQVILFRILDVWSLEVGEARFPPAAKALRYALFDELGDLAH
jgi:hypothetical protein